MTYENFCSTINVAMGNIYDRGSDSMSKNTTTSKSISAKSAGPIICGNLKVLEISKKLDKKLKANTKAA